MSTIIAMCIFCFSMSISPGPVNFISLSSSSRYGFRKSLPFVSGATIGFTLLLTIIGLGLSNFLINTPIFYTVLKYIGVAFIGYMGYKTLTSNSEIELNNEKAPQFLHGFLINAVNPKAWLACIAGISAFHLENSYTMLFVFITIYFFICYPSLAAWAFVGSKINLVLRLKKYINIFNKSIGIMLIITAFYLLLSH